MALTTSTHSDVVGTATNETCTTGSCTDSSDTFAQELRDEFCKKPQPKKTKQDWKSKNKRKLPRWAR